jgi:hypothetical protein
LADDRYFDRQGREISPSQRRQLCDDEGYWRLGSDLVLSVYRVSTVWIGTPQVRFETLVWVEGRDFEACDVEVLQWRYATEVEAEAGHKAVVEQLSQGIDPKDCRRPGVN